MICRHTQAAAVGLEVTLTCTNSRRPWAMNTSTCSVLTSVWGRSAGRRPTDGEHGSQERTPSLSRYASWSSPAIASNRATADHNAQLPQLASDPLGAPQPVVAGHGRDQVPYRRTEMRTSTLAAGLPTPEQAPALPMPAHYRLGCDEGQMPAPADAEPASEDPQELVPEAKPSLRSRSSRTGEHRELMA